MAEELYLAGKTVIIADDEAFIRSHLSKRLRELGLKVFEASSGTQVLNLMGESPDLVLMDVRMPEQDGFETTRLIKADEHTSGIPVILLSALSDEEDIQTGLKAGADEFLCKPVTFAVILETINRKFKTLQVS